MKLETTPLKENKIGTEKSFARDEIIQRMQEARARIVALGERLLTSDEVLEEVAEYRSRGVETMKLETKPQNPKTDFTEEELEKMSPLGRELWALRAKVVASGVPLLTWEQLDEELAERHRYDEADSI